MTEPAQSVSQQNWKLTLAYDGTDYYGWQVQPDKPTIQGELQAALGRIIGERPLPQGSGRTDAGVHALGQVASFALTAPIPAGNLLRALNRTLPPSIRVVEARKVKGSFHARHSAVAKTYEYRLLLDDLGNRNLCPPFLARYVTVCHWALELNKLQSAATAFVGEHDFTSFAATKADLSARLVSDAAPGSEDDGAPTAIRTIFSSDWVEVRQEQLPVLVYRVRGNGFLHHMVRNLVGTMIDVARGQIGVEDVPTILAARSRSASGPTAPARGLFLHSVEYDAADE